MSAERDLEPDTIHATSSAPTGPLRAGGVIGLAFSTYRARFWRVAGTAMCIFAPLALLQSGVDHATRDADGHWGFVTLLVLLAVLVGIGLNIG
jgi:hypothetical protein